MKRNNFDNNMGDETRICGGAVLDLFRNKYGNRSSWHRRGGAPAVITFDQRPLRSNTDLTPSISSSECSLGSHDVNPKTALLSDRSRGSSSRRNSSSPYCGLRKSPLHSIEEIAACDSEQQSKASSRSNRSLSSKERKEKKEASTKPKMPVKPSIKRTMPNEESANKMQFYDFSALGNGRDMWATPHHSEAPKRRQSSPQVSSGQVDIIEKLTIEKKMYETETNVLREEMQQIRKQLDEFKMFFIDHASKHSQSASIDENPIAEDNSQTTQEPNVEAQANPITAAASFEVKEEPIVATASSVEAKEVSITVASDTQQADLDDEEVPKESRDDAEDEEWTRQPTFDFAYDKLQAGAPKADDSTEDYWMKALALGADDGDEDDDQMLFPGRDNDPEHGDDAFEQEPLEDFFPSTKEEENANATSDIDARVDPPEIGVDPPACRQISNIKTDDLEDDLAFVSKLLSKYKQNPDGSITIRKDPVNAQNDKTKIGREFSESQVLEDEREIAVCIENMEEVDLSYTQREAQMKLAREAFEKGDTAEVDIAPQLPPPNSNDVVASKSPNSEKSTKLEKKNLHLQPPSKDTKKIHDESGHSSRSRRSVRFEDVEVPKVDKPSRQSVHFQSDDDQAENQHIRSNQSRPMRLMPPMLREVPKMKGPTVHEFSEREEFASVRSDRSSGLEIVAVKSDQYSEADNIDYSTSMHHAFLWSNLKHNKRTAPAANNEASASGRSDRTAFSTASSDVMEGIEESTRSECTVAEVRDPGQIGRKGGLYKIKMSKPAPTQTQKMIAYYVKTQTNRLPRGHVPADRSDRSQRSAFRGHVGEYEHMATRLV